MKKLLVVAGVLAAISFASCKKECTCKTYAAGKEVATSTVETKEKCSSLNTFIGTGDEKTGIECK